MIHTCSLVCHTYSYNYHIPTAEILMSTNWCKLSGEFHYPIEWQNFVYDPQIVKRIIQKSLLTTSSRKSLLQITILTVVHSKTQKDMHQEHVFRRILAKPTSEYVFSDIFTINSLLYFLDGKQAFKIGRIASLSYLQRFCKSVQYMQVNYI